MQSLNAIQKEELIAFSKKFTLGNFLGQGSFGQVFQGKDLLTDQNVAVKLSKNHRTAEEEIEIYRRLNSTTSNAVPMIYGHGQIFGHIYLAMDLLGPSLDALHERYGGFTKICMLSMGIKMLDCLQFLHSRRIIHGDIKGDNFAISAKNPSQIVIFDFGLARTFDCKKRDFHGSLQFASIGMHNFQAAQPKDDIESLGYVLAGFLTTLPWTKVKWSHDNVESIRFVKKLKINKDIFALAPNCFELTLFFMHVAAHKNPCINFLKQKVNVNIKMAKCLKHTLIFFQFCFPAKNWKSLALPPNLIGNKIGIKIISTKNFFI